VPDPPGPFAAGETYSAAGSALGPGEPWKLFGMAHLQGFQKQRIVLQSKVKWHGRRVDLHRRRQSEKTLDNYIFGRCTSNEQKALAEHLDACSLCAKEIRRRETMVTLLKAVLSKDGR
jgi:hypothetical protein